MSLLTPVLTFYFLLGLTGEADGNQDRKVTFSEVQKYLSNNIPYMARKLHDERKQTPYVKSANMERPLAEFK